MQRICCVVWFRLTAAQSPTKLPAWEPSKSFFYPAWRITTACFCMSQAQARRPRSTRRMRRLSRRRWRNATGVSTTSSSRIIIPITRPASPSSKAYYGASVTGPEAEADRIPGLTRGVTASTRFDFAGHAVEVIETPGHTLGHVTYYFPDDALAFTGDTLFSLGCGKFSKAIRR